MKKKQKTVPWTLSIATKKGWENFASDEKLRQELLSAIKEYDRQIEYIKDPENKMSLSNIDFERNVLLDHTELIIENHLNLLKK